MLEKINRRALESYFACQFKSHLALSGAQEANSDYLEMISAQYVDFKTAIEEKLTGEDTIPRHVVLTTDLLTAGLPLILDSRFEDEYVNLEFDGIVRQEGASRLGSFYYAPIVFYHGQLIRKLEKQLLESYAAILEILQGRKPTVGFVYLKDHTRRRVTLSSDAVEARNVFRQLKNIKAGDTPALRLNDHCPICEFHQKCQSQALKEDSISLLRGISETEITRLHSKGIFTVNQLSYTFKSRRTPKRATRISNPHHFALQALAIREQKVFVHGRPLFQCSNIRVYLDIEGMPDHQSYYLIGVIISVGKEAPSYHQFWADNEEAEQSIFVDFLRQLDQYNDYSLIHFGNYELRALRRIKSALGPAHQSKIDKALERSINILSIISPHVYFPTYSNSLKDIARYLNFEWTHPSSSGLQSIVWRSRWLLGQSSYKEKILQYNRDDCTALSAVTEFVETIISPSNIGGSPPDAQCVYTGTLAKDKDQSALFGKKEFSLLEFSKINECAYFDYQRDRVFARIRRHRKSNKQRMRPIKTLSGRVNDVIKIRKSDCINCGARKLLTIRNVSRKIIDLKITKFGIRRWITRYHSHLYRCNRCKTSFTPIGYPKGWSYGSALVAWCIYHHVKYGINLSQICKIISETFKIPLRVEIMYRFKAVVAQYYAKTYDSIRGELLRGRALYVDETPVNLWKSKGYVWVLAAVDGVHFFYKDSREGSFLPELLGDFGGVLVSDFFTAYDSLVGMSQQRCLIHLMRDLNDDLAKHPFDVELRRIGQMFASVLQDIVTTIDRFGLKKRYLRKHKEAANRFCKLTVEAEVHSDAARKYRKSVDKYRDKLFTFLDHDDVAWNNNNAEHAMKSFERYRRFSDGRMTKKSIQDYLVILSISETCEYQGRSFLDELMEQGERLTAIFDKEF